MGARILRNLDLLVLALALPVFLAADLPIVGWLTATAAWVLSRVLQYVAERRAVATGNRRVAMGARAVSLVGRLYLVGLTVFLAGLIERKAGLAAGVLSVAVFTVWFITLLFVKFVEEGDR